MNKTVKRFLALAALLTVCAPILTVSAYADAIAVEPEITVNWVPVLCASILIIAAAALTVILRRRGKK